MAARSRGLGITSKDMDASRLVFVVVRDAKPKRKVAISVPDNYTLDQFLGQVKVKLKLSGIADMYFSANGNKLRSISELQDIDELCVVEGPDAFAANGSTSSFSAGPLQQPPAAAEPTAHDGNTVTSLALLRQQSMAQERHKVATSADHLLPSTSASYAADEEDHKYVRRAHPVKRTLQRLFPNLFAPGLPVTNRDAQIDGSGDGLRPSASRRRRIRRSSYNLRNLLLVLATMSCVATMLYMFIRVSNSPAVGDVMGPGQLDSVGQAAGAAEAVGSKIAAATTEAVQQAAAVVAAAEGTPDAAGGTAAGGVAGGGGGGQTRPAP